MPALDWITIEGFKSIKRIERLSLAPINVLIGPNGSGKSNFIGVFSFLHEIRAGRLKEYVIRSGGADRILHFGAKVTPKLKLHLSFGGNVHEYEITFIATDADELSPTQESCIEYRDGRPVTSTSLGGYGPEAWISHRNTHNLDDEFVDHIRKLLDGWRFCHFHDTSATSPLKKTAGVNDNRFLRHDGANLAAFLYFLSRKHGDSYNQIRRTLQLVAPFFDDFRLEPLVMNEDTVRLEWRHRASDAYFDASSFSDGSLRFIALATVLLQPAAFRPSVILLGRARAWIAPVRAHDPGFARQAGFGRNAGRAFDPVVVAAGSLSARRCPGGRPRAGSDRVPPAGCSEAGAVAGGLQPRPTLEKERARRPSGA